MKPLFDNILKDSLQQRLVELEKHFKSDILVYNGPIVDGNENIVLQIIEELAASKAQENETLLVILTTTGGSPFAVERYVSILRYHYREIHFLIPDYAYSAGTIFCMSGDKIYMDYFSVLGPIDPQVPNKEGKYVPALGYLDKVNELLEKAANQTISQAEFIILKELDLAELRTYEQARDLTIDLLKKWLVDYKFKTWVEHRSNPELIGQPVTLAEKQERAEEIAVILSDNKRWKSHGRPINITTLIEELHLEIEDYSKDLEKRVLIRAYSNLLFDYIQSFNLPIFIQTRHFLI
jgi:hypothetical protein